MFPMYLLQRHPLTVEAHFDFSLVLTYAFPWERLAPLLPEGLAVDRFGPWGFVAIAMVQTRRLRPALAPRMLGQSFFLTGYRIFTTFKAGGRTLRGLYILRSDTNRRLMAVAGNLLTHYRYRTAAVNVEHGEREVRCRIRTPEGAADLEVTADLRTPAALPAGSPFATQAQARRFAGPLPHTFDEERETGGIIVIKATRRQWNPRAVNVEVKQAAFLERGAFAGESPQLASAFYVQDIDYQWNRGVRHPAREEAGV
jgi:hypothetical protein